MFAITRTVAASSLIFTTALSSVAPNTRMQAVSGDGHFQLDYETNPTNRGAANVYADVRTPPTLTGDDWDLVYSGTASAFAAVFLPDGYRTSVPNADPQRVERSFFTGGGSKDTNGIMDGPWIYDTTDDVVPDADDIVDAFAAAYENPADGHMKFYFGADRFDWSGDKQIGFWFFREPVTLAPVGADGTGAFVGMHTDGDMLVLADFRNGGRVGRVTVYRWTGDDATGELTLVADSADADCSTAAGTAFCAVVNNLTGERPPWPYLNKNGGTDYGGAGALFEGGIDMTALFGEDVGCYSSFLAETRSSHAPTAQLKDFVLGDFAVCGVSVEKTGSTLSKIGDTVDYTITVQNTGHAKLYKRNIGDTLLGSIAADGVNVNPNGYVIANSCGDVLKKDESCTITLRRTVQPGDPDPLPNTVDVLYTEKADFTGVECTASDDHSVELFQPALLLSKDGAALSKISDDVAYTFVLSNASSVDSPDLVLDTLVDDVIGDLSANATAAGCDVLGYGEACSFVVTRTVVDADPDPLVNTVAALYHPRGFPNDIVARDAHSVNLFQPSVSIVKRGDTLSKIGDEVTYSFVVTNTSSADSPALVLDSIMDDVIGDLTEFAGACASLAPGASCSFDVPWTVAAVDLHPQDGIDDDPIINTAVIHFHPEGFTNDIVATASHELNLFQPAIAFEKMANTRLSKATDDVVYTIVLNNVSSPDSPPLICDIADPQLGLSKSVTLTAGEGDVTNIMYTVKTTDADPLVNTASATCSPIGFPNVLSATSSWTVELFQPSVAVEKTGDVLSKSGDEVEFAFKVTNTSSPDSPNLVLDMFSDDMLRDLSEYAIAAGCGDMAPGAVCEFSVKWTVPFGVPDPLVNTVEVHYHPVGFPNDITATASHELNLFQPSITFDKRANVSLSKATDEVVYTFELVNTSSSDSPPLKCAIEDTLLGMVREVTLDAGATNTSVATYIVRESDPDPLVNTASVLCSPIGFPNELKATDTWTVELFQPGIRVTKTGPAYTKQGDTATYLVTIDNTSSSDAPDLVLKAIDDSLAGSLMMIDSGSSTCYALGFRLASGASCKIEYGYVVVDGQGATLTNTVSVQSNPDGFDNAVDGAAQQTATLLHPSFSVSKVCKAEPVGQGGPAVFSIRFANLGDADLMVAPSEGAPFEVRAGEAYAYDWSVSGPFSGTVNNTVTGDVTLSSIYGLPNAYTFSASASCAVVGRAKVLKTVSGKTPATGQSFTFELRQGAAITTDGTLLASAATDAAGLISFTTDLTPDTPYQLCEVVMPGWNTNLATAGDGSLFVPNSVIPPTLPNPNVNNMTVCTSFTVPSGATRTFAVDNAPPPGGRALTIGFWKNWASCSKSGGGQKPILDRTLAMAQVIGDSTDGHATLPGIVVSARSGSWWKYASPYFLVLHGSATTPDVAPDCLKAVRLLDKSTIDTGKKMASDPAWNLAAQLTAAELNFVAGAYRSSAAVLAVDEAVRLLAKYSFDGRTHGRISTADANRMNQLARILDDYNNDR